MNSQKLPRKNTSEMETKMRSINLVSVAVKAVFVCPTTGFYYMIQWSIVFFVFVFFCCCCLFLLLPCFLIHSYLANNFETIFSLS